MEVANELMSAARLREKYGARLVGAVLVTPQYGDYPGGEAKVTELDPDPAAPEIVFTVSHPTFGEIGVFETELCELIKLCQP